MKICCVWWTTKEEALADAAPYSVRSVLLPAASVAKKCAQFFTTQDSLGESSR